MPPVQSKIPPKVLQVLFSMIPVADGETLGTMALVEREWFTLSYLRRYSTLNVIAFRARHPHTMTHTRTFDDHLNDFRRCTYMHGFVRRINFCGPRKSDRLRNSVEGVDICRPRLCMCAVRAILDLFPRAVQLAVHLVDWQRCGHQLANGQRPPCLVGFQLRSFKQISFSMIDHIDLDSNIFYITHLASHIDTLLVDRVDSGATNGSITAPVRCLSLGRVDGMDVYSFYMLGCQEGLRILSFLDMGPMDVPRVSWLINRHRNNLSSLRIGLLGETTRMSIYYVVYTCV